MMRAQVWVETLGCPKNKVDSDKISTMLAADGYETATRPEDADLIVVNTCAFIDAAREESIETILEFEGAKKDGAKVVVTGCMAERYGAELAEALPEVHLVAGFGEPLAPLASTPVALGTKERSGSFDLLELPRTPGGTPWAYLKVAEGCDRICGFCAIPSFRGPQRSRSNDALLGEVAALSGGDVPLREVVLIAQDLASFGRDRSRRGVSVQEDLLDEPTSSSGQPLVDLIHHLIGRVEWIRLLYLYPSGLTPALIDAVLATGVPYFDLSLQHVSRPLLRAMRRWGDGDRFLERIAAIRALEPSSTFRSSFIVGYPGETEEDHRQLVSFLEDARLDWAGFFPFSPEDGTHAVELDGRVERGLMMDRLRELAEIQDAITAERRDLLVGQSRQVLVDQPGIARSVHEAPEIDGVIVIPDGIEVGSFIEVDLVASLGTDLIGQPRVDAPPW